MNSFPNIPFYFIVLCTKLSIINRASKTVDIESTENLTMQTEVSRQSSDGPLLKTKLGPNIMTGKSISFRSHSDDEATRRQVSFR